jgi:poly(A) polymerase
VNARLEPAANSWMTDPSTRAVMRALTADGGSARFVGGAVRNALLGEPVVDVDIATPLVPEGVIRRLQAAGLGAVPTGIEHGTVTAVSNGKPFEVTTLRRDVETFGRRATVVFTTDWAEDAARRDFTINALYTDEMGAVFDYFGGLGDIAGRRVRFVGDAHTRIREDYLRILRLFRFHAWYGKGALDADALAASVEEKAGLKLLSGERVQKELLRLLEAPDPASTLRVMRDAGILAQILPEEPNLVRLQALLGIENDNGIGPDQELRLAALLRDNPQTVRSLAGELKLSNALRDRLVQAAEADSSATAGLSEPETRKRIYRLGAACFRDQLLLRWAESGAGARDPLWRGKLAVAQNWGPPKFALDGNDVMALGIEEGPEIGKLLKDVEAWWVEQDFAPDRAALLQRLKQSAEK